MSSSKRITYKCTRPNPLFEEWLVKLLEDARETNSKLTTMLQEALTSLSKYPLPLNSGAECAILQGFDKRLCIFIDSSLDAYNNQLESTPQISNSQEGSSKRSIPDTQTKNGNNQCSELDTGITDEHPFLAKRLRSSRKSADVPNDTGSNSEMVRPKTLIVNSKGPNIYKPSYRSGGYAILIALLEHSKKNCKKPSLTKDQIIDQAQKYCEESFVRPKPESFYTAWSNMSKLVAKGLIVKSRQKKVEFSLTDQGIALATILLEENVNKQSVNDFIFNNASSSNPANVEKNINEFASDTEIIEAEVLTDTNETVIEMAAGTFDIILLIDKNETGGVSKKNDPTVTQFRKYPDLKHEYRSLKVGDFLWIARHKVHKHLELVLPYVTERKRMDDLGASIKDGRFHEQKFRLTKCGLSTVIYLVESYGKNQHVGLPVQSLMQAIANTRGQEGFMVHSTKSLTHSAKFLAMFTKSLINEYKDKKLKGCNKDSSGQQLMTFEYFNKSSAKTKPLTVMDTFIKMLLQLKGLSVEKALAITKLYSGPNSLMKAYDISNVKEGQCLIANLKYGELTRNVGPQTSKAIYQLFSYPDGD